jgi:hypothetical protein
LPFTDGKVFLTAALDGARLWSTATCQPLGPVLEHVGLLTASFSPTGRWVATAGLDGKARLWETSSGRPVASLRHSKTKSVEAVAFSPDESMIVIGGSAMRIIRIVSPCLGHRPGSPDVVMRHRGGPLRGVQPDGKLVASGSAALEKQSQFRAVRRALGPQHGQVAAPADHLFGRRSGRSRSAQMAAALDQRGTAVPVVLDGIGTPIR